jgi:hypothetical protein
MIALLTCTLPRRHMDCGLRSCSWLVEYLTNASFDFDGERPRVPHAFYGGLTMVLLSE